MQITLRSLCTFLVDGSCAVHPMRPVVYRQFNVFTRSCAPAPAEDPYYTRRGDILVPIVDHPDRVFAVVLPFSEREREQDVAMSMQFIRAQIMNLQEYNGKKLVKTMKEVDAGKSLSNRIPAEGRKSHSDPENTL